MEHVGTKKLIPIVLLIFMISSVSSTAAVNSQDWKDIYSGIKYSYDQGHEDVYFVRGPYGQALMDKMPEGEVTLVESADSPMAQGFESKLEANGYSVNRKVKSENLNTQLGTDKSNYIVVPEDYPSAAIAAAPISRSEDAWVVIVNEENLAEIEDMISDAEGNVMMLGDFSRDIQNTLEKHVDEEVLEPNRFKLSVKMTERYIEDHPETKRAYLADGSFLETELVNGESPVLLSGTNLISEPVKEFLTNDPDHSVRSLIVFGNQLTQVGKQLTDTNITKENQTTNEQPSVFVKFGTARGDSSQIMALNMFPLPQGNISLAINQARYDPTSQKLLITYRNTGDSRMYELTSFRVLNNGETVGSGSDRKPVFIAGNDQKTVSYDTQLSAEDYQNAEVEFSTSFGSSPENLNTYLTEAGEFSPPLRENLTVEEVNDSSNVSLEDVSYSKGLEKFIIKLRNTEETPAFVQTDLLDVKIQGQEQSLSSDMERIPPNSVKKIYVPAEMDSIDLEENQEVSVEFRYGEDENILPRSSESQTDLEVRSGLVASALSNTYAVAAGVIVVLLGLLAYWKRKLVAEKLIESLEQFTD